MEKRDKDRALPYFPRTENYLSMRNYIEELANLPARMLLDVKFAEEFADVSTFVFKMKPNWGNCVTGVELEE